MTKKTEIAWNMDIFHSKYKGYDVYKVHPQKNRGYDPAFVLWFTKGMSVDGRPIYKFTAYTLKDLKEQFDTWGTS